jgi:hypothetical protein
MPATSRRPSSRDDDVEPVADELVVRPAKLRSRLFAAALALMAVVGVVSAVLADGWGWRLVGSGVAVGVLYVLIVVGPTLWRADPLLVVNHAGLVHPRLGRIGWDDVEALPLGNFHGRYLTIRLVRPAGTRFWRTSSIRISEAAGGIDVEELRTQIELRADRTYPH